MAEVPKLYQIQAAEMPRVILSILYVEGLDVIHIV
jgi:hypothetical protein